MASLQRARRLAAASLRWAYARVPSARHTKLEPKAMEGIFVGYSRANRTYRVWVPNSQMK
eukprot:8023886-Pyramimonas_sp.AAC.1